MCVQCSQRSEEAIGPPETGAMDSCELPHGCWNLNPGPLQEQLVSFPLSHGCRPCPMLLYKIILYMTGCGSVGRVFAWHAQNPGLASPRPVQYKVGLWCMSIILLFHLGVIIFAPSQVWPYELNKPIKRAKLILGSRKMVIMKRLRHTLGVSVRVS